MAASWPTSTATDASLSIAVNSLQTTLSAPAASGDATLTLSSTTGFPTAGYVTIDNEVIRYTGVSAGTLTGCVRGSDGTTAAAHLSGAAVSATIVAAHHNSLKDELIAVEADLAGGLAAITGATPASTATSILNRLAQITQQIKNILGSTNWYDAFTQIKGPDGAAGTPSYTFTTQTNMGMYRFGTDTLSIAAGGVSQVQVSTVGTQFNKPLTLNPSSILAADATFTNSTNTQAGYIGHNAGTSTLDLSFANNRHPTTGTYAKTGQGSAQVTLTTGSGVGQVDAYSSTTNNGSPSVVASFRDTGCILRGTTTNDSAATGNIGERVSSVATSVSAFGTTVWGDVTSISLTAGDWDVSSVLGCDIGTATWSDLRTGISTTTGNSAVGLTYGDNFFEYGFASSATTPVSLPITIPHYRISISATTTVYLKGRAQYSAGLPTFSGRITARRAR